MLRAVVAEVRSRMQRDSATVAVPISEDGYVRADADYQNLLGSAIAVAERWKTISNQPARSSAAKKSLHLGIRLSVSSIKRAILFLAFFSASSD